MFRPQDPPWPDHLRRPGRPSCHQSLPSSFFPPVSPTPAPRTLPAARAPMLPICSEATGFLTCFGSILANKLQQTAQSHEAHAVTAAVTAATSSPTSNGLSLSGQDSGVPRSPNALALVTVSSYCYTMGDIILSLSPRDSDLYIFNPLASHSRSTCSCGAVPRPPNWCRWGSSPSRS